MQASNTKLNEGQLSKLTCVMNIFHCLFLVKKQDVPDVDSAFVISETVQDIGLETMRFFEEKKITHMSASPQNFRKRPSKFCVL
jgi:hypothetical protein